MNICYCEVEIFHITIFIQIHFEAFATFATIATFANLLILYDFNSMSWFNLRREKMK